jgi:hypothetical protein
MSPCWACSGTFRPNGEIASVGTVTYLDIWLRPKNTPTYQTGARFADKGGTADELLFAVFRSALEHLTTVLWAEARGVPGLRRIKLV